MSKIKMIVTDLDGTLLTTEKKISPYTQETIKRLQKQGILFVIATARPIRTVTPIFLNSISYDVGIFHNGAVILEGNQRIASIGIQEPYYLVHRILKEVPDCHMAVEVDDHLYANFNTEHIWPGVAYIATNDFIEIKGKIADKLMIEADSIERMRTFEKHMTKELYLQLSEHTIAMVLNKEATKIKGIQTIAQRHGISMEEIVAFGDDYNDIDMLEGCGIGVAMGNALEEVKAVADEVCDTNDRDGIAKCLEKLFK